jgi:hypothetical protein
MRAPRWPFEDARAFLRWNGDVLPVSAALRVDVAAERFGQAYRVEHDRDDMLPLRRSLLSLILLRVQSFYD